MKLSDGEKLIVAMLADIHTHLNVQGQVDAARVKTSLFDGHLWSLKWDMPGLFEGEEPDEITIRETGDFLTMWEFIEDSYNSLGQPDQAAVQAQNSGRAPTFSGFDGNHERHFGVARHMVNTMNRFGQFSGRNLNSHGPSVEKYRRMYDVFSATQQAKTHGGYLTQTEIIGVLNA